ncbi:MAG: class I SAM-dependent methyltransferase [Elusimicrobiota bacterium]|nr:class I SAM-dependent methyltransferase [Endomicrobiia bacterium]MDW8166026.1 class I SAM-dependent methyltransferase [Elusimicrobiota bacterium]
MKNFISFRRYYIDKMLLNFQFYGKVLDVGGKKINKRGNFVPPENKVEVWHYLNIDSSTNPDFCCSAEHIPVEDGYYDIVIITEVLEHLENPDIVLKECYRVLKKNGKIVVTIPFLYPLHKDPYDYQRWLPDKINKEFLSVGFKNIEILPMGGLFAVLFDLFFISITTASKNPDTLMKKIMKNKFILSFLVNLFKILDEKFNYKSKHITTGYFIIGEKI